MLKIGITCFPTYGGSSAIATELGMFMAEKGHEVHFVSSLKPFRLKKKTKNVFFHPVKSRPYPVFSHPLYTLTLASRMKDVAETYNLDLFHVHYAIPHSISAYLAKTVSTKKIKIITTLHGTDIHLIGLDPVYFPLVKFGIDLSDGVTAVSSYLKNVTENNFHPSRKIKVIPNFVTTKYCKKGQIKKNHRMILIHISNFRPIKRTPDVIKIFNIVRKKMPAHLFMVGEGPDKNKCISLSRQLNLTPWITFMGNQKNIFKILSQSDIFILPSGNESFGLAALEAMSCEVPVIATRSGGISEVVKDKETGYLLNVGDVRQMAKKTIDLLGDPEKRKKMGKEAGKLAVKKFSLEKIGNQYERYYRSILKK